VIHTNEGKKPPSSISQKPHQDAFLTLTSVMGHSSHKYRHSVMTSICRPTWWAKSLCVPLSHVCVYFGGGGDSE